MKKFNPDKELKIVRNKNGNYTTSKFNSAFIPLLVVGCSVLALIGVTFSYKLLAEDVTTYTVKIDIINGNESQYVKKVTEGAFKDKISSTASFGSITCMEGSLSYDPITETVYSPFINHNTSCVIAFRDDGVKKISLDDLPTVNDNSGTSYYYKGDAKNNYLELKGMMFRIVRINGDGTIRIILNQSNLSSTYGSYNFEESNALVALNGWFSNNFANDSYVVEGDFDVTNYVTVESGNLISLDGYYSSKVGLLSVREAVLINDGVTGDNYINTVNGMYLANPNGTNMVFAYYNGSVESVHPDTSLGLRPVINIKGTLVGEGTINNPYKIEEE